MERPVIIIKPTITDKILEVAGYIALVALWILVTVYYQRMPEIIPIHFKMDGEADGYGEKGNLFLAPAICTLLFIFMAYIQSKPHKFNYGMAEITPQNAEKLYNAGSRFVRFMKLDICLVFLIIEYHTYRATIDAPIGNWVFGLVMALIMIPVFYLLIKVSANQ